MSYVLQAHCKQKRKFEQLVRDTRQSNLLLVASSGARALRLRGGGFANCLGCCFGREDPRTAEPSGEVDENGKPVKKRKIGRVERGPEIIKAPIGKVYKVITDYDHYTDWSGDGIKHMKYVQRSPKFCEINYITGVFGIFFHFSLFWAMTPNERVIFRTTKPSSLLQVHCPCSCDDSGYYCHDYCQCW